MKDIFEMYKNGDIVYPSAIARFYKEPVCKAYKRCDERVGMDLKKMYMIRCPHCGRDADNKRYYAVVDLPKDELGCVNCDSLFVPTDNDVFVLYEKANASE